MNFAKFPRIPVLDNTTGRLLLIIQKQPSEVFCDKYVLRNFAKFIEKQLCQSLFFNKVAGLRKKEIWHRCFSVKFVKFLRTVFLREHLLWLLLIIAVSTEVKGELANETVNCDTKTKAYVPI